MTMRSASTVQSQCFAACKSDVARSGIMDAAGPSSTSGSTQESSLSAPYAVARGDIQHALKEGARWMIPPPSFFPQHSTRQQHRQVYLEEGSDANAAVGAKVAPKTHRRVAQKREH